MCDLKISGGNNNYIKWQKYIIKATEKTNTTEITYHLYHDWYFDSQQHDSYVYEILKCCKDSTSYNIYW